MKKIIIYFFCIIGLISCKKMVQIPPPSSTITTSQVFADSADATTAILGLYSRMSGSSSLTFGTGYLTIYPGMSADELLPFGTNASEIAISTNNIIAASTNTSQLWTQAFPILYQANAIIEGLKASKTIDSSFKKQLIGEAKFFRGFIDFYLVNLFGEIPLITSTDYNSTAIAFRSSVSDVYASIINDLQDAQISLPGDYGFTNGERARATKWAATALLSRVFLYERDYNSAISQANSIVDGSNSLFSLQTDLNNVFQRNSSEAILQWNNSEQTATFNGTVEGCTFIPASPSNAPKYYLTPNFLASFELNDQRKISWVQSYTYSRDHKTYFYPYKYKIGNGQKSPNGPITEVYTILRLAEQYLIRAEAEANSGPQQNLGQAIADLNIIRNRAGLSNYSGSIDQNSLLNAIYHERQIELFAEFGHRWLDLKRTNQVSTVFNSLPYKSAYQPFQQLYPIPPGELETDPNLTQNPGY